MQNHLKLNIRSLGSHGEGIGSHDGLTVFVPGALPGELVSVEVKETHRRFGRAELLSIITPSPDRVNPICPLFAKCGGCQTMHLAYEQQLIYKRQKVIDALKRIGKIENAEALTQDCIASPSPLAYRNKIQLPIRGSGDGLKMGLFANGSHNLIEVEHCFIHADLGEQVYKLIQPLLKQSGIVGYDPLSGTGELRHLLIKTSYKRKEALVLLVSNLAPSPLIRSLAKQLMEASPFIKGVIYNYNGDSGNVILGTRYETLAGQSMIEEELLGLRFNVSPASFFQVNPAQAEQLYAKVSEWAREENINLLVDAYCGVGTLALALAHKVKKVIGIECVPEAVADAKQNAQLNGMSHVEFVCGHAEELIHRYKNIDILLLNPPRKGCAPGMLKGALLAMPKKILYISCDPATLARDLAILAKGGYHPKNIQPFDMFPQTAHVETVVLLTNQI